jgi:uncharacterized protein YecT (DUF1311 family)
MISSVKDEPLFGEIMKSLPLLLLLAAPFPAMASPAGEVDEAVSARYSAHYHRCMDGLTGDFAMTACSREEHQRQDASLNRVYRALLGRLPRSRAAQLRASQRVWLRNRDSDCLKKSGAPMREWGTMHRLDYAGCRLESTIRRTVLLERYRDGRASLRDLDR